MWLLMMIILAAFIYWLYEKSRYVKFEVDDDTYQIEKYSPDAIVSLNTLVKIREKLEYLVAYLKKKYPNDALINRLDERFEDTILREANPDGDPTQTSYTINKGDTIVLCLRTNDNLIVDFNTLMYVAIHELSHIYSSSYHHNKEFWHNMKYLIDQSIDAGIYHSTDYSKVPVRYCGMTIGSNIPIQYGGGSNESVSYLLQRSRLI